MLRSKGMIFPPLHIPRVFRETGNHCYSECSIPHPAHMTMPSSPRLLSPSHLVLFWAPHEVCYCLPINLRSGTSALSPCHRSPLCLLCSHSSVQYLQDTGFIHAMGKAVLGRPTKEQLSAQLATHRRPQWRGYNTNVSHKLGLTTSRILALKKLHKETCTAHLRSFYGVYGKKPGNQYSANR